MDEPAWKGAIGRIALALLLLAGCSAIAPASSVPIDEVTATASEGARVNASARGDTLLVEVKSESGIGSAQVDLGDLVGAQGAARFADVILRLHLRGMEELRFVYPGAEVIVAVSSSDLAVREMAQAAGDASKAPIGPGSPYWMDVGILREQAGEPATIPLPDGYFDVSVPADFLRSRADAFTISWVDFYR